MRELVMYILGDWGTPMGLVIAELRRKPDLVYFDEEYSGKYLMRPIYHIRTGGYISWLVPILRKILNFLRKQSKCLPYAEWT